MSLSIRSRITLWFVGLSAVLLAAFSVGLWVLARRSAYATLDETLRERARAVAAMVELEHRGFDLEDLLQSSSSITDAFADPDRVRAYEVTTPGGHRVATPRMDRFAVPADAAAAVSADRSLERTLAAGEGEDVPRVRLHVGLYPPRVEDGEGPAALGPEHMLRVAVVEDTRDVDEQLATLALILGGVLPVVLLAAAGLGRFLSARIAAPLAAMSETAREIESTDLARRLPTTGTGDEIDRLAGALNDAFGRLQRAFERQARFTADAAHELRTPVSIVRTQAEVALRREREPEEYREALGEVVAAARRMEETIEGLLVLARADAGALDAADGPVDLAQVARETAAGFETAAAGKGIALAVREGDAVPARAERRQVEIVLRNLISNALRHSGTGGRIDVEAHRRNGHATLEVKDRGCGIPAEALPHIFDRFYRVDEARARRDGGAGLGLSIVREIAERAGGGVAAKSEVGLGTTITVRLPAAP